jgi:hypothetical protein
LTGLTGQVSDGVKINPNVSLDLARMDEPFYDRAGATFFADARRNDRAEEFSHLFRQYAQDREKARDRGSPGRIDDNDSTGC